MLVSLLLVLAILAVIAAVVAVRLDGRAAAEEALHEALARGEIRPEEYAAHLRAIAEKTAA